MSSWLGHEFSQPVADPLPGAVPRPPELVAVHGVPVGVGPRKCPPLPVRRRHGQSSFGYTALSVHGRPAHLVIVGVGGN